MRAGEHGAPASLDQQAQRKCPQFVCPVMICPSGLPRAAPFPTGARPVVDDGRVGRWPPPRFVEHRTLAAKLWTAIPCVASVATCGLP